MLAEPMNPDYLAPDLNWVELLEELKQKLGVRSDAALARHLGFTPQFVSDVRRGGKPASPLLKYRVLDLLLPQWTASAALSLLDQEVRVLVLERLRDAKPAGAVPRAR